MLGQLQRNQVNEDYNPTERVDGHPVKLGYYIGSTIIKALIDRGYDIGELTLMSSEKIIQIYQKE